MATLITPEQQRKRFFAENREGEKFPITFKTNMVVIQTGGVAVTFTKTNRGQQFKDSRGRKVVSKNEWGDKIEKIVPLMISESELKYELSRLLDNQSQADAAYIHLIA